MREGEEAGERDRERREGKGEGGREEIGRRKCIRSRVKK